MPCAEALHQPSLKRLQIGGQILQSQQQLPPRQQQYQHQLKKVSADTMTMSTVLGQIPTQNAPAINVALMEAHALHQSLHKHRVVT